LNFPAALLPIVKPATENGMNDLMVNCQEGWYKLSPFQAYNGINGETSDGKKLNTPIRQRTGKANGR